jgi:uncharacterized metal-binding protein YceD (DUF177 family)
MSEALNWLYRTTEIPDGGLRQSRSATPAERTALASALDVLSLEDVLSEFVIRATGQGRFRLAGSISGQLTQSCVVTLEPVAQAIKADFDVEFWPPSRLPAGNEGGEDDIEALSAAEIEPIEHGCIDAGRIVFETLSAAIDPYPRKPGAEFTAVDVAETGAGPFAALKKLKDRS